jgi:nitroreductase/Pyruvate/2-oxoacid:ferredoxin oxidoreductase delta subunit
MEKAMLQFNVDAAKCTRCRQCVLDCPARIIEMAGAGIPFIRTENEERCIRCQHCLAICPPAAISIFGKDPANSLPLSAEALPSADQMMTLVRGRRTVRRYRDENVDPALIRRLLDTLSNAPSGINRRALTFSVIDDKAVMQSLRVKAINALAAAQKAGRVSDRYAYLMQAVPAWFENGADLIFRGAPHLLIVSASEESVSPPEDVNLALAYFEMLAQSAGLGTVWCGMAKMTLEVLPELKEAIGLPSGHFYYAMLFGIPSYRYARTVQRDGSARVRSIRL